MRSGACKGKEPEFQPRKGNGGDLCEAKQEASVFVCAKQHPAPPPLSIGPAPTLGDTEARRAPQRGTATALLLPSPRPSPAPRAHRASIRTYATALGEAHKMAAGAGRAAHVT